MLRGIGLGRSKPHERPSARPPKSILIVTGLSGAGKSTVAQDARGCRLGNGRQSAARPGRPAARRAHAGRTRAAGRAPARRRYRRPDTRLRRCGDPRAYRGPAHARSRVRIEMLFLDCSGSVLERRYTETRRRHPLALDRPAADGIARERELLEPLRRAAEHLIDTTDLAANGLQQLIRQRFAGQFESTLTRAFLRLRPRDTAQCRSGVRHALPAKSLLGRSRCAT